MTTHLRPQNATFGRRRHRAIALVAAGVVATSLVGLVPSPAPSAADPAPAPVSYTLRTRTAPVTSAAASLEPTFSPDGTRIYLVDRLDLDGAGARDYLLVLDADTGQPVREPIRLVPEATNLRNFTTPRVSANGDIYLHKATNQAEFLHVDPDTFAVTPVTVARRSMDSVSDGAGGVWTSLVDGTVTRHTGTTAGPSLTLVANPYRLGYDTSRDRLWVGQSGAGAGVGVFDATTGAALADLDPYGTNQITKGLFVDQERGRVLTVSQQATGGTGGWVRIYDLATMARLSETKVLDQSPTAAAYDPDTGVLLVGALAAGHEVRLIDTTVTPLAPQAANPPIPAASLAVNPVNGDLLALNNDGPTLGAPIYSRHVATPEPGDGEQVVVVEVPEPGPGELVWAIDGTDHTVTLDPATDGGDHWATTGSIRPIVIADTRDGGTPWSISGQVSDFTGGVSGHYLGWTPTVLTPGGGAEAGDPVPSGFVSGDGLADPAVLASAPAGHPVGTAVVGADLDLRLPIATPAGTYTATLTITALS